MSMKPYATEKPTQILVKKADLSFDDKSGTKSKEFKKTKKKRQEQRQHRRAQNKSARQFLKKELSSLF